MEFIINTMGTMNLETAMWANEIFDPEKPDTFLKWTNNSNRMRNSKSKNTFYFALLVGVMVFIFIQSAFPASVSRQQSGVVVVFLAKVLGWTPDNITLLVRKAGHFLEYLVLGVVLALALKERVKRPGWTAWGIGTLYAVTDELHQLFVNGRSCELRDVVIDAVGVAIGV